MGNETFIVACNVYLKGNINILQVSLSWNSMVASKLDAVSREGWQNESELITVDKLKL